MNSLLTKESSKLTLKERFEKFDIAINELAEEIMDVVTPEMGRDKIARMFGLLEDRLHLLKQEVTPSPILFKPVKLVCLECGMDNIEIQKNRRGWIAFVCKQGQEGGKCNWVRGVNNMEDLLKTLDEMQQR